jgi:hypothetical protein
MNLAMGSSRYLFVGSLDFDQIKAAVVVVDWLDFHILILSYLSVFVKHNLEK